MTTAGRHGWTVDPITGSARDLHALALPDPPGRRVWLFTVDRPALVLGSTQPDDVVDRAAVARAGGEVVRRHSGGGAVLLVPGEATWVDVVIPSTDPLWVADVGAAFLWLGRAWRDALTAGVVGDAEGPFQVHDGPLVAGRWSPRVCFAGLGPGEVTVGHRKVVGLSQRRTRHAVRFQCVVHHRFQPDALAVLLTLGEADRSSLVAHLTEGVATVSASSAGLSERLVAALPR